MRVKNVFQNYLEIFRHRATRSEVKIRLWAQWHARTHAHTHKLTMSHTYGNSLCDAFMSGDDLSDWRRRLVERRRIRIEVSPSCVSW